MADFNYQQLKQATHIVVSQGETNVLLRQKASNSSKTVYKMPISSQITMLREYATGNSEWAYVKVVDTEDIGYVRTKYLLEIDNSTKNGFFLPKKEIQVEKMSPLALAIIPDWQETDEPYYHRENGEWWVSVVLPYTCLNSNQDLESKKQEAKLSAIEQMYEYFGVSDEILPQIGYGPEGFNNGLLSSYVKDHYLSSRPNSKLRMLVIIPAIYLEYVKDKAEQASEVLELQDVDEDFCIKIDLETINDQQQTFVDCLAQQYNNFILSNFKVNPFKYEKEIKKQRDGYQKLKSFLTKNNISLDPIDNQTKGEYCSDIAYRGYVKVCFDKEFKLYSVLHTDNTKEDKPLLAGFSVLKNSYPFNEPRFAYLFLKQVEICRTEPTTEVFFKKYVIDPRPTLVQATTVTETVEQKQPGLFGTQELGLALDTGAIIVALAKDLGDLFGLDENIDPKCFTESQQEELAKKASEARNLRNIVSGDKFSSPDSLCDLVDLLGPLGAGSLEAVYDLVLRDIDFGTIWRMTFPDFGDNDDSDDDDDDDSDNGENDFGFGFGDGDFDLGIPGLTGLGSISIGIELPSFSLMKIFGSAIGKMFLFAISQILLAIIIRLLKARCEMLLAAAATGGLVAVGLAIYNNEEETSDPLVLAKKNYGAENINDAVQNSIGVFEEKPYEENVSNIFDNCGIPSTAVPASTTREYLDEVSKIISPVELLNLFDGTTAGGVLSEVLVFTKENYSDIYAFKNNTSKIREMFICLGENISPSVIEQIQNDIVMQLENPDLCRDIKDELLEKMKEKCPDPILYDSMYQKEIQSDVQKFQEIIEILESGLEEACNANGISYAQANGGLVPNAVPNLFNNYETGEQGLLASPEYKPLSQNFAIDRMTETLFSPTKTTINAETKNYFNSLYSTERWNKLISVFTEPLVNKMVVTIEPEEEGQVKYVTINNEVDAQVTGLTSVSTIPRLYLNPNGTSEMTNLFINDQLLEPDGKLSLESVPIAEKTQELVENSPIAKSLKESGKASNQELMFYELIRKYYKENVSNSFKVAPYYITKNIGDEYGTDDPVQNLYDIIISANAKKLAKNYGKIFSSGDIKAKATQYYLAVAENLDEIVDYQVCKDFVSNNYTMGDNEDFEDSEVLSKKQLASLLGSCHLYARSYILEYFLRSLVFMTEYNTDVKQKLSTIYKDFSSEYIKSLIKLSITNKKYEQLLKSSDSAYEYLKTVSDTEVIEYQGPTPGLDYFINTNISDVQQKIISAIDLLGGIQGAGSQQIPPANVIVDLNKDLWVHTYASTSIENKLGQLYDPYPVAVKEALTAEEIKKGIENTNSSLFEGNNYEQFKNGKFFLQKYYYVEDYSENEAPAPAHQNNFFNRPFHPETKYAINEYGLNVLLDDNGPLPVAIKSYGAVAAGFALGSYASDYIKGFKFGYRLCYGIAYDPPSQIENTADETQDPDVYAAAKRIFKIIGGDTAYPLSPLAEENDNHPAATIEGINQLCARDKSMICFDGESIAIGKKYGESIYKYLLSKKDSALEDFNKESSFSVIIPIIKVEENIDLSSITVSDFIEIAKSGGFENNNLKTDLINSEEFNDFLRFCVPTDDIIYFLTFYGMQKMFYKNNEAQNAFFNSKESLDRLLEIIINAKKFDYLG